MPDPNETQAQLNRLAEYLHDLRSVQAVSYAEYESDKMLRRYLERMLHMAIEASIVVALRLLVDAGLRSPDNYHDIFIALGERSILPPNLVQSMTYLVEVRNLLVHQPDVVDDTVVYGVLKRRLDDFQYFIDVVAAYYRGEPMPVRVGAEASEGE